MPGGALVGWDPVVTRRPRAWVAAATVAPLVAAPTVVAEVAVEGYTVRPGDTLWDLADRHYDNPLLWPQIWQRNPAITDPNLIFPGQQLDFSLVPRPSPERERVVEKAEQRKKPVPEPEVVFPPEPPPEPEPDPPPEIDPLLDEAQLAALAIRADLNENRVQDAVRRAEEGFDAYAGLPPFDFQAGRAHFHNGDFDRAMTHFDRAVMVEPTNPRYRLELARAQFAAQDYESAERHFRRVLAEDPPEAVAANIERFLEIIDARLQGRRPATDYWAEAGLGYDSNPLSSVEDEFSLFGFIPVEFDTDSDTFHFQEIGARHVQPRTRQSSWKAEGRFQNRGYFDEDDADQQRAVASGALQWRPQQGHTREVGLELDHIRLGGDHFRTALSLRPQGTLPLGPRTQLRLAGQLSYADYEDDDRDSWIVGVSPTVIRILDEDARWIGFLGGSVAREDADADEFSKNRLGGVLGAQYVPNTLDRYGANLTVSHERVDDPRPEQLLFADVSDSAERSTTGRFAINYRRAWTEDSPWSWFAEASYTEKWSNVDLFEYDRREAFLGVRYER